MCWSRVRRLGVAMGLLVAGVPSWASESDRAFVACVASMGVPVLKRTRIGEESKSETVVLSGRVGADGRVKVAEDRGTLSTIGKKLAESFEQGRFQQSCRGRMVRVVFEVVDLPGARYRIDWAMYRFKSPNRFIIELNDGRRGKPWPF